MVFFIVFLLVARLWGGGGGGGGEKTFTQLGSNPLSAALAPWNRRKTEEIAKKMRMAATQ